MPHNTELYKQDFYAWTQAQAALLDARQFDALDIPHLVEEITSLGKSEQRELTNRLSPLLEHLLKLALAAQHCPRISSVRDGAGAPRSKRSASAWPRCSVTTRACALQCLVP